ncbi:PTS transporter subunit EIIC [Enterococcus saccharolyticus]|uniref:PTS beta-glucoside transporter subunit EIIBCA n=1 Tax=Candidatus Enterococcus willemsii TaxID=1857215 RepID=A0ABQ6YWQ5_9ENTE|nr:MULTISPECIES: PTS transporter subunit EIIC [Enterococcus]KAF1301977.1 PTS beta-glucoside transporter subunit EIIBCA [Enterococcus sp. CU12B]MCD5002916.1 PTS transporter subunit EIIC [Enterococcus saccharolyticus]
MDYQKIVKEVLEAVGGKENISSATHCVTRLRLTLKNDEYNQEKLENVEGAKGVFFNKGQLQVVFGTGVVERVYEAFNQQVGGETVEETSQQTATEPKNSSWKDKVLEFFKAFSDIFVTLIPAIVGCAMLLGIRSLFITSGLFGLEGTLADNYVWAADAASFLNIVATGLNFLPVFVAYSATKRFGGNPIFGIIIGLVLVHPELGNRFEYVQGTLENVDYWNFFGMSVPQVAFQGGIFPAILTSLFMAKFEKIVTKYTPHMLTFIVVPMVTILVSAVALFTIFGPLGDLVASGIGAVADFLYMKAGIFGAGIFAALLQPLVITGTQHMIGSIEAQLLAQTGFNYIQPLWAVSIISQGGAAIGMFILSKKGSKRREISVSSFVPTLVGVSEPAIFAVNLKDSVVPFIMAVIGAGIGGVYMKLLDVKALGFGLTGIPGMTIVNPPVVIHYIIGCVIAFVVPIVLILIYNKAKGVAGAER